MNLRFLSPATSSLGPAPDPVAHSPMEAPARAAGALLELRDGWMIGAGYGAVDRERDACGRTVGFCDVSHLGKLGLKGSPGDPARMATELGCDSPLLPPPARPSAAPRWWQLTPTRGIVICEPRDLAALRADCAQAAARTGELAAAVDLTTAYAALAIAGPRASELLARICSLDVREAALPVGGLLAGPVARVPGFVVREADDRFLVLVGSAFGEYAWAVVADAASHLGGRPVGLIALPRAAPEPLSRA